MGDGERGGWEGGGERLNWIRGVLIETGEKGGKLLELVHTEASILFDIGTHTHTSSQGPEGGVSSVKPETIQTFPGRVQHQETVAQSDITPAPEQCGAEQSEEACMGKVPSVRDVLICL